MRARLRCALSGVLLSLLLTPMPAHAQWRPAGFGQTYQADTRSTFVIGGVGYWSRDLSFGTTWTIGAGMELPVNTWALIPRLDLEGNDGPSAGGTVVRATLGGRLTTLIVNHASYLEAGVGALRAEITQDRFDGTHLDDTVVSPCFILVTGIMSDPDTRPSLLLEGQWSHPTDRLAPGSLLGRFGIRF